MQTKSDLQLPDANMTCDYCQLVIVAPCKMCVHKGEDMLEGVVQLYRRKGMLPFERVRVNDNHQQIGVV